MTISDAIKKVGDSNVMFQLLESSASGATKTKLGTKITICTDAVGPEILLGQSSMIGLIVWVPREKWDEVLREV